VRKLQHLQKRVLRTTGIPNRYTLVCESQVAFEIPYMYNYLIKLCGKQKEDHLNPNVCGTGQEAMHRKYIRSLNVVTVKPTTIKVTNCSFKVAK
jgi:hypothetical protein